MSLLEAIFWVVDAMVAIHFLSQVDWSVYKPETKRTSGPGFYLNSTDAALNGALFKMCDDGDGGPGFYI